MRSVIGWGFIRHSRRVAHKLMGSNQRQLEIQPLDVFADRLIELDLPLFRQSYEDCSREHLGYRADAKEHIRCNWSTGFDVRNPEAFRKDEAVTADDGHSHAGCVGLFEFFKYDLFKLGEINPLG